MMHFNWQEIAKIIFILVYISYVSVLVVVVWRMIGGNLFVIYSLNKYSRNNSFLFYLLLIFGNFSNWKQKKFSKIAKILKKFECIHKNSSTIMLEKHCDHCCWWTKEAQSTIFSQHQMKNRNMTCDWVFDMLGFLIDFSQWIWITEPKHRRFA